MPAAPRAAAQHALRRDGRRRRHRLRQPLNLNQRSIISHVLKVINVVKYTILMCIILLGHYVAWQNGGPQLRECCTQVRQKWQATAGTKFTKPGLRLLAELCIRLDIPK